jgi:hypothetical protein
MTRINPWRLVLALPAGLALVAGLAWELSGERGTPGPPLLAAGAGLGALWLAVSAICWEIRRR